MSSCLILQDKNNYFIGADTACSVFVDGEYYRHSNNMKKIFTCGNDVYFCAGNLSVVQDVVAWVDYRFSSVGIINVDELSKYLYDNYRSTTNDVFDVEVVICRKTDAVKIYQLSQYNEFKIVEHNHRDNGVSIICCGYKTNELNQLSRSLLLSGNRDFKYIYHKCFSAICDNKTGGNVVLYHNGDVIMYEPLNEENIQFVYDFNNMHLLLAEACIASYIEGSTLIGGTLQIGDRPDGGYNFDVTSAGVMTAQAATIKGNSTIAGWNVTDKYIDSTVSGTNKRIYLASASDSATNWICATNSNGTSTFYVTKEGKVYATSGEIGGWSIDSNKISGWDDADKCFAKMDKTAIGVSGNVVFGVYNGTNWPFYVDGVGALHATEATIEGKITSSTITGGTINIGNGTFKVDDKGNVVMKAATIDGYATDGELSSAISVTEGKITAEVSRAKGVEDALSARITVNANGIATSVQKGSVISSINQSAESITINANKISLAGKTISLTSDNIAISSTNFSVTKDGNITAKGGTIGGWSIGTDIIIGKSGNYEARMNKGAIGTSGHVVFGVYNGSKWSAYIDGVGKLVASGATIEGHITATSGNIGGCTIADGVFTAGTIKADYIAGLPASQITSGQFASARIPNLSADKITSGTISTARLDASVITTDNFSSKYLTTGRLTVTDGAWIGDWSVSDSFLSIAHRSGTYGTSLSDNGVACGSQGTRESASWLQIVTVANSSSDIRLKNNIDKFNNDFDKIFDGLKPVKFRYNDQPNKLRIGFIAQDVKSTFEENGIDDFGGLFLDYQEDGEYYNLIKEEFVALNTWQIQKLKTRVAELEDRLAALEERN